MSASPTDRVTRVIPSMRGVFLVGSVLVTLAGLQLFLGTEKTDQYFAWHVKNSMTAAFLGGFYFTALGLALPSSRRRAWADARVGIPGVVVFLWLTMLATLLHLDQFHFGVGDLVAQTAAWLWLIVYCAAPPAATYILILQRRQPGEDPPRTDPFGAGYQTLLLVQSLIIAGVGVALFVAPGTGKRLWPWTVTPLTARAISAWLVGLGIVLFTATREADWGRIRPAVIAYTGLGVLQGIALIRYGDLLSWDEPCAWIYLAVLGSVLLAGVYGWVRSGRAGPARRSTTAPS